MKLLLLCLVSIQMFAICPACIRRRAQMMAKCPSLEKALPDSNAKMVAFELLKEDFNQGNYQVFFIEMHNDYLKARHKKEYQSLLTHRSAHFYHGKSVIDTFTNYPKLLNEIRTARSNQMQELAQTAPSYLRPILSFLSYNPLTDKVLQSLNAISNTQAYQEVNDEFYLSIYLLNNQFLRKEKPNPDEIMRQCLALDYERLRRLEGIEFLPEIDIVRDALTDLAKLIFWEKFLCNVAADCFKLPSEDDKKLAQIQKDYMKQRSECIRKNRELLVYR